MISYIFWFWKKYREMINCLLIFTYIIYNIDFYHIKKNSTITFFIKKISYNNLFSYCIIACCQHVCNDSNIFNSITRLINSQK